MVQRTQVNVGPGINTFKILYAAGIVVNLIFSLGHMVYAFAAYDRLNEPALWFFSGALTIIFNAALNTLCLREYTIRNHTMTMIANLALLVFSIVLAVVVTEPQTLCFAVAVFYTAVISYSHNRHMQERRV